MTPPTPERTAPPALAEPATPPHAPAALADLWARHIAPGERVLSQGAPGRDTRLPAGMTQFLLPLALAALTVIAAQSRPGAAVPIYAVGLALTLAAPALLRRSRGGPARTLYLLSDRAAYIARRRWPAVLGLSVRRWPITPGMQISRFRDAVLFAKITRRTDEGSADEPIGFFHIAEAAEVHDLMRRAQAGLV